MKIIPLVLENENYIKQCASLLMTNFSNFSDVEIANKAVFNSIDDSKINIIAVDENDTVLGWISGLESYNVHVWEIQPLVINREFHRMGIGKLLVSAFEKVVASRNGITIILGTQDDGTSLSGIDIYPDIFKQIENIKNLNNNPYEFYLKVGFKIVGVIPDSNGFGKPDILMAKRVKYE